MLPEMASLDALYQEAIEAGRSRDYERAVDSAGSPYLSQDTESWSPLLPSIGMSWTW